VPAWVKKTNRVFLRESGLVVYVYVQHVIEGFPEPEHITVMYLEIGLTWLRVCQN